jgi:hypothetical protein
MEFKVGQLVYVIHTLGGKRMLIPFRVCEKNIQEKLDGTMIKYMVEYGTGSERITNDLDELSSSGRTFLNLEDAKKTLLEQANKTIEALIMAAKQKVIELYGEDTLKKEEEPKEEPKKKEDGLRIINLCDQK